MSTSKRAKAAAAAARSSKAKRRPGPTPTQKRESELPVIYGPGCWCGEPFGHDWPGRDEGAAHPREARPEP